MFDVDNSIEKVNNFGLNNNLEVMSERRTTVVYDRRQAGKSLEDDAKGLVERSVREGTPLGEMSLRERGEDKRIILDLARREFARLAGITLMQPAPSADGEAPAEGILDAIPEQEQLYERLNALVVKPVNALPEADRRVKGRARTGEEIARAIPDQAAFLHEVDSMQEGTFFELNEKGQLVMRDRCPEANGLGENALQARIGQTRVVYRDTEGQTQVMTGKQYFKVTKRDGRGNPLEMELSEEANQITPDSILMAKGLPTLQWDGANRKYRGEYARMNDQGQFEKQTMTWTEDASLDASLARYAYWNAYCQGVYSVVDYSGRQYDSLGSRGVLRVNLNFES